MDRIKEKMKSLSLEAEEAHTVAEDLKAKVKTLEQENLSKEQEITSLSHKNQVLEAEVEKLESGLKEHKGLVDENRQAGTQAESLTRRVQVLEDEAEHADKQLREVNEKLRQTDVKSGHYERKVQALESERDQWIAKYEEMSAKYEGVRKELNEFVAEIGNI